MASEMARDTLTGRCGSLPPDVAEAQPLVMDSKCDAARSGGYLDPEELAEDAQEARQEESETDAEDEDLQCVVGDRSGHLDNDVRARLDELPRSPQQWYDQH